MTAVLSRKERDLLQRESLILDTAQQMLHRHGYGFLTMDRLAEAVEYSKGTLYNHFSSKEDLVCSLCCRCVSSLIELFERAAAHEGPTRERFSAVGIAYELYYQLNPMDAQNIQTVRVNAVREKCSEAKLKEMEQLEQRIIGITRSIVDDAIACGDLPNDGTTNASSIVFGVWAMHYGGLLLNHSDMPLNELGFNETSLLLWKNSQKLLDGYGWKPASTEIDTETLLHQLANTLFADCLETLAAHNTSRENPND